MNTLDRAPVNPLTAAEIRHRSQPQFNAAKLRPKEHGAYAVLAVPLVSSMLMTGVTQVGICVAVAAVAGFLANEPLLVVLGHRGRRAQQVTPAAKSRLAILLMVTIVTGVTALALGPPAVRWALAGCFAMAIVGFALSTLGKHRTPAGQIWGVMGLSAPVIPILLAGGFDAAQSLTIWATWLLGFAASTVAVRSVIAAQKNQPRSLHVTLLAAIGLTICGAAVMNTYLPLVTLPMIGISTLLLVWPPPARHLKRVGWALVVGTVASAVLMIQWAPN